MKKSLGRTLAHRQNEETSEKTARRQELMREENWISKRETLQAEQKSTGARMEYWSRRTNLSSTLAR
jgi:hypothetical protein